MRHRATETYPAEASAPGSARALCRATLTDALGIAAPVEFIGDVELVVSELVSNAVDANAARIDLTVLVGERLVRVEVRDDAPGLPRASTPGPESRRGRGLLIVGEVATAWGFETGPAPKCVWAEFALG